MLAAIIFYNGKDFVTVKDNYLSKLWPNLKNDAIKHDMIDYQRAFECIFHMWILKALAMIILTYALNILWVNDEQLCRNKRRIIKPSLMSLKNIPFLSQANTFNQHVKPDWTRIVR